MNKKGRGFGMIGLCWYKEVLKGSLCDLVSDTFTN